MTHAVPSSTYRLQMRSSFTLNDAAALADYLRDLGVGAVYLSPILASTSGSEHGYDTVDATRVDESRGGEAGWQALLAAAAELGLGVVVDIVPNHLGISAPLENPAWWDVLQFGADSTYAHWFDIDWSRGRIVVPILGDDAELALDDGELRYLEHRFPIAPGTSSPGASPAAVHDRQHYELIHHSRGDSELNYRRFFAVSTLAGVRMEDESVFAATHQQISIWASEPITGLRVDHPDGLVDPQQYLNWLRTIAPEAWITVEKILEPGETLPSSWPVQGTTGYDAMGEVCGVFVDPDSLPALTATYQRLTGDDKTIAEHIEDGKRMVTQDLLVAEVRRMTALAPEIDGAAEAIAELAVAFDVYRSYLPEGAEHLDQAIETVRVRAPHLQPALAELSPRLHDEQDELAQRLQQLSGATMAKGVEDTAFYRYARFIALNEVGGDPDRFGLSLEDFHQAQQTRQADQPQSMTSLSTHDTKRGEDVRARLAVISEIPHVFAQFAETALDASTVSNRAFGYFLAQTFVGVGSLEPERMHAYVEKAMREAADPTSWKAVQPGYEAAVHDLVDQVYSDQQLRTALDALLTQVEEPGWSNSLGQKLVQLTMPGVPDVYQGTELWEDSLVDPDNRRPVDFTVRRSILNGFSSAPTPPQIDATGAAKLWVTHQGLKLRHEHPERFASYRPVPGDGPAADHLLAFDRGGAITLATRLPLGLGLLGGWGQTTISLDGGYNDKLTGRTFSSSSAPVLVADLLTAYPVALLVKD